MKEHCSACGEFLVEMRCTSACTARRNERMLHAFELRRNELAVESHAVAQKIADLDDMIVALNKKISDDQWGL